MNFETARGEFEKISNYLFEKSQWSENYLYILVDALSEYEKIALVVKKSVCQWQVRLEELGVIIKRDGMRMPERFAIVHESENQLRLLVFDTFFDSIYNVIKYEYNGETECDSCYIKNGFANEWHEQETTDVFSLLLSESKRILLIVDGMLEVIKAGGISVQ